MSKTLGIYVHIPFCQSKCDYCSFYSLPGKEEQMDMYQTALITQIKGSAETLKQYKINTIYFGGGTPSFYGERRLRSILSIIKRYVSLSKTAEITVECNPDSVDIKSMSRLKRAGVNRISLGMQSANSSELSELNRPHDFNNVKEAVEIIRNAGIDNLSIDLMFGLPYQDMNSWNHSLSCALSLSPEHISAYGLKTEEGTPLFARASKIDYLPDEDLQADMYVQMVSTLTAAGYTQYEISNFAKTGKHSKHNLKYWAGHPYIGFGCSAHSDVHGFRYSYSPNLTSYIENINQGTEPLDTCEKISHQERAKEYLLLRMRTHHGIEEWEYRREFNMNFDPIEQKLELFEQHGWAIQTGNRWHFTVNGFLISNQLIGELLDSQGEAPEVSFEDHFRSACLTERKNLQKQATKDFTSKGTILIKKSITQTKPIIQKLKEEISKMLPSQKK